MAEEHEKGVVNVRETGEESWHSGGKGDRDGSVTQGENAPNPFIMTIVTVYNGM